MKPIRHVINIQSFSRDEIDTILDRAAQLEPIAHGTTSDILSGRILATLFYEPSTRTRLSFDAAMKRLGGDVIDFGPTEGSSVAKGENLADTISVMGGYADAIVLRHPREGAARMASEFSSVPVINAGDGAGQHPTQTLLDLYTIRKESKLNKVKIALVGDLKYGRTVHSLAHALSMYSAEIYLVAPDELRMPDSIKTNLIESGIRITETKDLDDVVGVVDVLYITRIQKERFPDPGEYQMVACSYKITEDTLKNAKDDLIIMHPLPRVGEIDPGVDKSRHAVYFKQSFYGVPVRMAILSMVMG
ncbi:MAG TPA: aspartate carbamoyltransferase [Methanosarcinales archaeon]|nr:aspartate carbamoyltransferase [Methanosarcinales archaeon]